MPRLALHTFSFPLVLIVSSCFALPMAFAQNPQDAQEPNRYATPLPQTAQNVTQQNVTQQAAQQPGQLQPIQPAPQISQAQAQAAGAPLAQVATAPAQPGQPGSTAAARRGFVGPPFQITPVEQQFVDQILQMWEDESSKIQTFSSRFELWEYDLVFGPGSQIPGIKSIGQLTYSKPDKGSFKINEIRRYLPKDPKTQPQDSDWVLQEKEVGAHWVCDGKAVYEYEHKKKQLVVQPLPPGMQGQSIVDGPLPFLFGAEADKLKRRYWIRSKQGNPQQIWLEAYPREQRDAANYHHVEIMLDRKTMQPQAIKVHAPNNQSHSVYMFDKPTINGRLNALFGSLFSAPRTPFGWKKIVQEIPAGPPAGSPQATAPQPTTHR